MREWRLLAIDGFEVDLPDTDGNAAEFGYSGSGDKRSTFPKARVVALAECGTHAFLAAEIGSMAEGEKTLAKGIYPRLRPDELLTADRNFCSFAAWGLAAGSGAALLWRAPTGLGLPVVRVLPDGTFLSVLINRRSGVPDAARRSPTPLGRSSTVGSAPNSTPPRRTWSGWSSTTCPTARATAPAS